MAVSPIATTIPLPPYAAAILLAALLFREGRQAGSGQGPVTDLATLPA